MALRTKLKRSTKRTNTKVLESINNYEVLLPNDRPKLVTSLDEVIENIKNFSLELEFYEEGDGDRYVNYVMENMSHYRAWYAYKDEKTGNYLFAPSKYIGYQNMSSSKYFETYAYMDGRKTEKILTEWFEMIDESEKDFDLLNRKLLAMFSATGKTINALFRINVLKREEENELLEKDLVDLIYKVFLGLSDESKALIKQKLLNKM